MCKGHQNRRRCSKGWTNPPKSNIPGQRMNINLYLFRRYILLNSIKVTTQHKKFDHEDNSNEEKNAQVKYFD